MLANPLSQPKLGVLQFQKKWVPVINTLSTIAVALTLLFLAIGYQKSKRGNAMLKATAIMMLMAPQHQESRNIEVKC
jgi:uncharacterized membrane protein YozB (DUF420 family)